MSYTRSFPQNAALGSTLNMKACVCLKEADPHSHKSFELQSHFFQSSSLGVEIALKILRTALNHPSGCASATIYFFLTEPLLLRVSVCIILWSGQGQKLVESQRGSEWQPPTDIWVDFPWNLMWVSLSSWADTITTVGPVCGNGTQLQDETVRLCLEGQGGNSFVL